MLFCRKCQCDILCFCVTHNRHPVMCRQPTPQSCSDAPVRRSGFGLMIPLSRSLVGKARGYDIDFLRCSFRLFPFQPLDGEMPSPKIGSLPSFSERFIRPEPPSAATRITNMGTSNFNS